MNGAGSLFGGMLGIVTPTDKQRWEQQRAQNAPSVGVFRQALAKGLEAMVEFGEHNLRSGLDAAHRVTAQQRFDESHAKIIGSFTDPRTRSIVETVDYETVDDRPILEME